MKTIITSKNLTTSEHLNERIEAKFEKLSKYFNDNIEAQITVSLEKGRQKLEATIHANGTIFRAEDTGNDVYSSIDKVVDRLATQMSKYKSKLIRKHKDARGISFIDVPDVEEPQEADFEIDRKKKFDLIPMSAEEAVLQMELVNHNFFIFLDMDTDSISVVYKRKDNGYGLLETNR